MNNQTKALLSVILAASPGTPTLTCRKIADAILASPQFARIIAEAEARAWDEGMKWGRLRPLAPGNGPRGFAANPYRAAPAARKTEGLT